MRHSMPKSNAAQAEIGFTASGVRLADWAPAAAGASRSNCSTRRAVTVLFAERMPTVQRSDTALGASETAFEVIDSRDRTRQFDIVYHLRSTRWSVPASSRLSVADDCCPVSAGHHEDAGQAAAGQARLARE
jgi:hypothetical protein